MDIINKRQHLQLLQILLKVIVNIKKLKKKKASLRRWWTKPYLYPSMRNNFGAYELICRYLQFNDQEELKQFVRMDVQDFNDLHELVKPHLQKQIGRRPPISSEIRLAATLHYLGHAGSLKSNALIFRVGKSTIGQIILETCKAIATVLVSLYVKMPDNEAEWLQIAEAFERMWNFPNCIGALDGKHIRIQRPPHGGSKFFNYKKFNSIVLMAVTDAHSRFTWFSIGDFGSYSDSSVFSESSFAKKLSNNELNLPQPRLLPNTNMIMPYVFISDEIFQLTTYLMKPFKRSLILGIEEKIFNYRLSRARFTVERAFGILSSKWLILRKTLAFDLQTINYIVMACICLHNYLITRNTEELNVMRNSENELNRHPPQVHAIARGFTPRLIRDRLAEYFSSPEGSVPWQHLYI